MRIDPNTDAAGYAEGLRDLADMIEQHPELQPAYAAWLANSLISLTSEENTRELLAGLARAAVKHGADVHKDYSGDVYFDLVMRFGPIQITAYAHRNDVCERIEVGSKTVTKTMKDPEALKAVPEVEVVEEMPVYEWRCEPLLAGDGS